MSLVVALRIELFFQSKFFGQLWSFLFLGCDNLSLDTMDWIGSSVQIFGENFIRYFVLDNFFVLDDRDYVRNKNVFRALRWQA